MREYLKKYMIATCLVLSGLSPAYADYAAIAAGVKGSSYVEGFSSMDSARNAAISACRRAWGTSCSVSTAEHSDWYFAAGECDGEPYSAASPQSMEQAYDLLFAKGVADGRSNCRIYATH